MTRTHSLAAAVVALVLPLIAVAEGEATPAPAAPPQKAETPTSGDVADLSLDDLLNNTKITIATKTQLSLRESPSVVTVVSRDEIESSGARDLIDVLRMVPGFSF